MNYYNHSTLNKLIKNYNIDNAYVFGMTNVIKENDYIYNLPLYMIAFINK